MILNKTFYFQEKYYEQVEGLAMGSPLFPVLANLFMEIIEQTTLENIHANLKYGLDM